MLGLHLAEYDQPLQALYQLIGICGLSAIASGFVKYATDSHSAWLIAALSLYSGSTLLLYAFFKSGTHSYTLTLFVSLLLTMLFSQAVGSLAFGEPVRWREIAILLIAICVLAWVSQSPSPST